MVALDIDTRLLPPRFRILLHSWASCKEANWCWEMETVYRKAASEGEWKQLAARTEKMEDERTRLEEEIAAGGEAGRTKKLQKELALLETELRTADSNLMCEFGLPLT